MTGCRPTGVTPTPPNADAGGGPAAAPVVAVAFSGGRDSTALLHATLIAAGGMGVRVLALHIHHGLSPNADAWLLHCRLMCEGWAAEGHDIAFDCRRLSARPGAGESVEAWARAQRYDALAQLAHAHGASLVLLGHHRRDQAETWLLQALRGGGMTGLSAMPQAADRDGIRWVRPWLHQPRSQLEAYLQRHGLPSVEDDSNVDPRFARNRMRQQAWPALTAAFPDAEVALVQAATWAQHAAAALAELAEIDLMAVGNADGIALERWLALSTARRANVLRAWLAHTGRAPGSAVLTVRLMNELPAATTGRWLTATGELRLHRGSLSFLAAPPPAAGAEPGAPRQTLLRIDRVARYTPVGWNGSLEVRPVADGGVPLAWLAHVELRARRGGERFQAGIGRPPRSLKKQFQDAGITPWDRDGPLVFSGGQLVYVPGLGLDARVIGLPGQPLVELRWQAGDPAVCRSGAG